MTGQGRGTRHVADADQVGKHSQCDEVDYRDRQETGGDADGKGLCQEIECPGDDGEDGGPDGEREEELDRVVVDARLQDDLRGPGDVPCQSDLAGPDAAVVGDGEVFDEVAVAEGGEGDGGGEAVSLRDDMEVLAGEGGAEDAQAAVHVGDGGPGDPLDHCAKDDPCRFLEP